MEVGKCPRPDLNGEPTDYACHYGFRRARLRRDGVCGLDFPFALRVCRQVSTPSAPLRRAWLGITIPLSRLRLPRIWQILRAHLRRIRHCPDSNVMRSQPYFGSLMEKVCVICEATLTGRQKIFCSRRCKNSSTNNRHQNYTSQQHRGRERRQLLIKSKAAGVSGVVTAATKRLWLFTISNRLTSPSPSISGAARTPHGTRFRQKRSSVNSSA